MKYSPSKLWNYNNSNNVKDFSIDDLCDFKRSATNFKIASFNPHTNGVRYLKTLILSLTQNRCASFWSLLNSIENRDIGNPIDICVNDTQVCLDYFQAVDEIMFLDSHINLNGISVLEIGAGYGRTCHALLSNHDIKSYYIIDLDNCLGIARTYLNSVLSEDNFRKIKFIPVNKFDDEKILDVDLAINIDSFAEMDEGVVRAYLQYISKACRYFYVKNPVGKYLDPSLDNHSQGQEVVEMALSTGILRDVIDIDDSRSVEEQSSAFLSAYKPATGWEHISHSHAPPWSYYWHAIYRGGDD